MTPIFPYVCPHCGAHQFLGIARGFAHQPFYNDLDLSQLLPTQNGKAVCIGTRTRVFLCTRCSELSIEIDVALKDKSRRANSSPVSRIIEGGIYRKYYDGRIYPDAVTPPVHPAVPPPLAEDYKEGWAILARSPKSSAVLARRCVQGAIRDFCNIRKSRLNLEINELKRQYESGTLGAIAPYVSHDLIEAIDNVRNVGNIAAHMEKDVNKVIPIEHNEAKLLLELVGTLFTEWYQAKNERETRLQNLVKIASTKADAKASES